jgi:MFS transporter, DHA1 family, multidrug resistance protein
VHWIVPTLSGLFTGFGILAIFMQGFMYLVDAYLMFSASAIAANTIFRSLFAAACPLFARQMFDAMGINWAASLLGFVSLVLVPVPLILLKYGYKLREKSRLAPTPSPPPPKEVQAGEEKETAA